jgi:hypothetical protein
MMTSCANILHSTQPEIDVYMYVYARLGQLFMVSSYVKHTPECDIYRQQSALQIRVLQYALVERSICTNINKCTMEGRQADRRVSKLKNFATIKCKIIDCIFHTALRFNIVCLLFYLTSFFQLGEKLQLRQEIWIFSR